MVLRRWGLRILCVLLIFVGITGCDLSESEDKESYPVTIHIKYKESSGLNYRDDAILYVDGNEISEVSYASEDDYEAFLTEGEHEIYLKRDALFRKGSTNKIVMDVSEDNTSISIIAEENTISGLTIEEE